MTRHRGASRSCAALRRSPPAPCRCTSGAPTPPRNSGCETRPPRQSPRGRRRPEKPLLLLVRHVGFSGQIRGCAAAPCGRTNRATHHRVGAAGAGSASDRSSTPTPISSRAPPDLLDDPVRAAAEADRQDAADIGRTLLAADIALVLLDQRVAQSLADRERRLRVGAAPRQRRVGRLVGLGEDHVGAPDDVVRPRLPAVFGAAPR